MLNNYNYCRFKLDNSHRSVNKHHEYEAARQNCH